MSDIVEIHPDYATALAACGAGYEDDAIAEVIARKTTVALRGLGALTVAPDHTATTLLAASVAAGTCPAPLRVLDIGGSCGLHYINALWFWRTAFRWAVVETRAMARRAAEFTDDALSFHTTIDDAVAALGGADLVHISGSLHYLPDPKSVLVRLRALGAAYVLLARFPAWSGPALVGIQSSRLSDHGAGALPAEMTDREVRIPITFLNAQESLGILVPPYQIMLAVQAQDGYSVQGNSVGSLTFLLRHAP